MISEQLLQTKIIIPRLRQAVVSRPRLNERLNTGIDSKLVLISAPAGFGKTTMVTNWISTIHRPVAWLSLDEGDNDPALCMEYFIATLRKVKPQIGAGALRLFRSSEQVQAKAVLTDLINEICSLSFHFVLVLDDYHVITNKNIHEALDFLLENLPDNMHLVILTRSDPPLHLSILRGRGQITELRAVDLRFTSQEVAEFLNQIMKLNLNNQEISLLDARSEGWAAALQMAAISLKGRSNTAEFIAAFNGSNRNIMDYLFEEVFEHQPGDIQSFLLETSILEQFTAPLCDAVTVRDNSGALLELLKRNNLFVIALDDEGRWYRYHHLFANLLTHHLNTSKPHLVPALYEKASLWYERNNLTTPAIEHALLGEHFNLAAELIVRHAETTLTNGELATLRRWIQTLPAGIVAANPVLIIYQVLAELWLHGGPLKRGEARLQEIAKLDPQGLLIGQVRAVQAILATAHGDTRQSVELANQALEILTPESAFWRRIAITCLGQFGLLRGEIPAIPEAINLYNEAVRTGKKTANLFTTVLALRRLAEVHIAAGHLHEARICYQKILELAVDSQGKPLPLASFGLIGMGSLATEWHDLDKAASILDQGIRLATGKLGLWQLEGYVNLARVRVMQGNIVEAEKLLQNARLLTAESPDSREFEVFVAANEIRLALKQGNLGLAARLASDLKLNDLTDPGLIGNSEHKAVAGYYSYELEQITLARVYLAQGRPLDALKILETAAESAERMQRGGVLIEIRMLEALAYRSLGNPDKAVEFLQRSLLAAEPEGYVSLFIDEGAPMISLLGESARHGIMPAYILQLLNSSPQQSPEPEKTGKFPKGVEPLSNRELDVLNLLEKGLSNKEIASQLCIELRTVKWHTGNIFLKLGVKNRIQAVARARKLNFLSA